MRVVIAGNGPAAHGVAERLRHHGHRGPVVVIGAERRPAYNRALLTSVLSGALPPAALELPPPPGDVWVRSGVTVTSIDRHRREVHASDGRSYGYDVLVLATGARPRVPDLPGLPSPVACTVRTAADCEWALARSGPAAVLGGGVLGVETALALRERGRTVHLVHSGPHLMHRQLDPAGAELLADHLRSRGVGVHLSARAVDHRAGLLTLAGGETLPAETLLLCAGVVPETGLARAAGLAVRRGVVVDDRLRTSDPRVHAVGDCAEYDRPYGTVTAAWDQTEALARLLTGGTARYRGSAPVVRLRAAGIDVAAIGRPDAPGAESTTLSDPDSGRYARVVVSGRRVVGAVLIGLPHAIATIGNLYSREMPVPDSRLGVLLGLRAEHWAGDDSDDTVICLCANVTRRALADAWDAGARDRADLAAATRATTGCGSCRPEVERLCGLFPARQEAIA